MIALRSVVLLLALGLLQVFLPEVWSGFGGIDWLIIYIALQALRCSFRHSILLGAGGGLIQDGLSGGILGLHAFAKTTVAALISTFGNLLVLRGPFPEALVAGGAAGLEGSIVLAWQLLLGRPASLGPIDVLIRTLATAAATWAILAGARRWQRRALIGRRGGRRGRR